MIERHRFLEELKSGVLVGDGAVGTELFTRGASLNRGVERLNLTAPSVVERLHRDYVAAGSNIVETNTFGANRPNLKRYESDDRLREIILAGVGIARRASGGDAYVAGSVGPLPLVEGEPLEKEEQAEFFAEVIAALLDGGVDLLLFETFIDLDQLVTAVRTARSMTEAPVIAQMAFEPEGKLAGGESIDRFVGEVVGAGADVVGANCGAGARAVRDAVGLLTGHGVPVSAYMNAGFAERIEERRVYVAPNEYLAETAVELVRRGARIVGGCCGTNPDTIRAIVDALERAGEVRRTFAGMSPRVREAGAPPEAVPETPEPLPPSGVLAELDPPKNLDVSPLAEAARELKEAGVSAVTLADNPLASVRVDVLATAGWLHRETGIPVIPHLTGRDRNRIALQSVIMGAHILGIRSILCVTGDPVRMYHETNTTGVFDVTSIGLVKLVSEFNSGQRTGNGTRTSFSIGVALNPNVKSVRGQINKLKRKMDAGAHFALTQPVFTMERIEMLMELLEKEGIGLPVFIGVMPLVSAKNAEFLHNEVPGIYIPEKYRERLKRYDRVEDQRAAGIEIAVELAEAAARRAHGIYIITPRNRAGWVVPVVEAAKGVLDP